MKDPVSTKEVMKMLGVGSTTIKRWADEGKLQATRTAGGHRRFNLAQVRELRAVQIGLPPEKRLPEKWIDWLEMRDLRFISGRIRKLNEQEQDWFRVADLLAQLASEIGHRWVDGDLGVVEEHISMEKLSHALMVVSSGMRVKKSAARCLFATPANERHTLGLSLTQLCMRSVGICPIWAGADVPSPDLARYVRERRPQLVAVTASSWQNDPGSLRRYYAEVASVCEEANTVLLLGGKGAWPEHRNYGIRCHAFSELKGILRDLALYETGEKI